ncbi:MAG: RNA-binding S4 domain-containing protein [Lewinellaceae bacterium]|nr:RNA-binding S4 domain-containing protein [Saprospiraceae bacterium]MCB9341263.1 RNA-binding S4 domain-containing protein [Lewinellaceae bacterium]
MTEFPLNGKEYLELFKVLKALGLAGTGGEAKIRIDNGEAKVNGTVETQRRKKLRPGDKVSFAGEEIHILV